MKYTSIEEVRATTISDINGMLSGMGFAYEGAENVGEMDETLASWYRKGDDIEVIALLDDDGVSVSVEDDTDTLDSWGYDYGVREIGVKVSRLVEDATRGLQEEPVR